MGKEFQFSVPLLAPRSLWKLLTNLVIWTRPFWCLAGRCGWRMLRLSYSSHRSQLQTQKCFNIFPGNISWHQTLWSVYPGFSPNSVFLHWFSFLFCCWEMNAHFDELELNITEPRGWCCCIELWNVCKLYTRLEKPQRTLVLVAFHLHVGLSCSNLSTEVMPRHFCAV